MCSQTTVGFYHCGSHSKALTFVLSSLLFTATVLEGLFGEYHSSSAALGKQCLGVTTQPPFGDWGGSSNTRTSLMLKTSLRSNAEER